MRRHRTPPANDPLSRQRTADLIRQLRDLERDVRRLKGTIESAKEKALTEHADQVHPERSRSRSR
jgi:hypothetical protein